MKISFTSWQMRIALLALDRYVQLFIESDDPDDTEYTAELMLMMRKLIKEIPAEDMPKLRTKFTDREWNKKMHGRDEDGDLGKPDAWRIHPRAA